MEQMVFYGRAGTPRQGWKQNKAQSAQMLVEDDMVLPKEVEAHMASLCCASLLCFSACCCRN